MKLFKKISFITLSVLILLPFFTGIVFAADYGSILDDIVTEHGFIILDSSATGEEFSNGTDPTYYLSSTEENSEDLLNIMVFAFNYDISLDEFMNYGDTQYFDFIEEMNINGYQAYLYDVTSDTGWIQKLCFIKYGYDIIAIDSSSLTADPTDTILSIAEGIAYDGGSSSDQNESIENNGDSSDNTENNNNNIDDNTLDDGYTDDSYTSDYSTSHGISNGGVGDVGYIPGPNNTAAAVAGVTLPGLIAVGLGALGSLGTGGGGFTPTTDNTPDSSGIVTGNKSTENVSADVASTINDSSAVSASVASPKNIDDSGGIYIDTEEMSNEDQLSRVLVDTEEDLPANEFEILVETNEMGSRGDDTLSGIGDGTNEGSVLYSTESDTQGIDELSNERNQNKNLSSEDTSQFDSIYDKDGFDQNGFNEAGFDKDGFDQSGFNEAGFDKDGFDQNGFNEAGYDKDGFDQSGFNETGFDKDGFDQSGFNEAGFDKDGFDQNGFNEAGFDKDGFDQNGFNEAGFDKDGFDQSGFNEAGFDKDGFDQNGFNEAGFNKSGFDKDGFNQYGYDKNGFDEYGYNQDGFDKNGFDKEGFNKNDFDEEGFNPSGYDKDGYDRNGFDKNGYDAYGYNKNGFNADGFDKDGYDLDGCDYEGYKRDGYDLYGYNRQGYDQDGYHWSGYDENGYDKNGVHWTEKGETTSITDESITVDILGNGENSPITDTTNTNPFKTTTEEITTTSGVEEPPLGEPYPATAEKYGLHPGDESLPVSGDGTDSIIEWDEEGNGIIGSKNGNDDESQTMIAVNDEPSTEGFGSSVESDDNILTPWGFEDQGPMFGSSDSTFVAPDPDTGEMVEWEYPEGYTGPKHGDTVTLDDAFGERDVEFDAVNGHWKYTDSDSYIEGSKEEIIEAVRANNERVREGQEFIRDDIEKMIEDTKQRVAEYEQQQKAMKEINEYLKNLKKVVNKENIGMFGDKGNVYEHITEIQEKLWNGQLDVDKLNQVTGFMKDHLSGRIGYDYDGKIFEISEFNETLQGLAGTTREIFTMKDSDGNFSYKSLAFRAILITATAGMASGSLFTGASSTTVAVAGETVEYGFIVGDSIYTIHDSYMQGDSGYRAATKAIGSFILGEALGAGIKGLTKVKISGSGTKAATKAGTEAIESGTKAATKAGTEAIESGTKAATKAGTEAIESGTKAATEAGTEAIESGTKAATEAGTEAIESGTKAATEAGTEAIESGTKAATEAGTEAIESGTKAATEAGTEAIESGTKAATEAGTEAIESGTKAATEAGTEAIESGTKAATEAGTEAIEPGTKAATKAGTEATEATTKGATKSATETGANNFSKDLEDGFSGASGTALGNEATDQVDKFTK
jgi:hypothetical protein